MLVPGDVLDGKYRVLRQIGEGGMGAVYEGEHLRIARRVAIKVMHAAMATERDLVERFEREAQAAAKIGSSYVVDVLDLGELASGERYLVMEYLEGESLATRLRRSGPMASADVAAIALQLLDGLAKVHAAQIIHRDLKPGNIFLARTEDGTDFVKLLDFGICKFTQRMSIEPADSGRLLGTLGYMSPELMANQTADARSDIYSVGVVLFRCVAGALPFTATNPFDLIVQIQDRSRVSLAKVVPGIDPTFAGIIHRAMAPSREVRFHDVREMREALARWSARLDRVDRLLAGFLEVDYVERRPSPSLPPRSRTAGEESPTLDVAHALLSCGGGAELDAMTRRLQSGVQAIRVEYDASRPTGEAMTQKLVGGSGKVPIRPIPRDEPESESSTRYSIANAARAVPFSRREAPTRPKPARGKRSNRG